MEFRRYLKVFFLLCAAMGTMICGCGTTAPNAKPLDSREALQIAVERHPLPPGFKVLSENNRNDIEKPHAFQKFWWVLETETEQTEEACRDAAKIMVQRSYTLREMRHDTAIVEGLYITAIMPGASIPYFDYSLKNEKNKRIPLEEFTLMENGIRKDLWGTRTRGDTNTR